MSSEDVLFLEDQDRILGIRGKKSAKAYPVKILNWHEIVNDTFEGNPIVITYCPLCGSGIGFNRKHRTGVATFGVSGLLYQSDLLMYDHQTESLWSQIGMQCVAGPLTREKLDPLYLEHTTWGVWKDEHPHTLVLSNQTGYVRTYDRDPYAGYDQQKDLMFPILHPDSRFHQKEWVLGVEVQGTFKGYPFSELQKGPEIIQDIVNGELLLIHYNHESSSAKVMANDGTPFPFITAFWFAWSTFHPETLVYSLE